MQHGIPDQPPQPEGAVWLGYNPMQPVFWDLAPHSVHTYVYRDVETALTATRYWTSKIASQRPPEVSAVLRDLPVTIFYRGQSEFTHRLLPTRLRGPRRQVLQRVRVPLTVSPRTTRGLSGLPQVVRIPDRLYAVPAEIIEEVRRVQGSWAESDPTMRNVDDVVGALAPGVLTDFDLREEKAVEVATARFPAIAVLDPFRRRATVRHYTGVPSALMDVSSDVEVAAFFATSGGVSPARNTFGMMWAIDLGMLVRYFHLATSPVP
jgi:hypothetical protein